MIRTTQRNERRYKSITYLESCSASEIPTSVMTPTISLEESEDTTTAADWPDPKRAWAACGTVISAFQTKQRVDCLRKQSTSWNGPRRQCKCGNLVLKSRPSRTASLVETCVLIIHIHNLSWELAAPGNDFSQATPLRESIVRSKFLDRRSKPFEHLTSPKHSGLTRPCCSQCHHW